MYYEAVKNAFSLSPLDPPGTLNLGDYVRIGRKGQVIHCGNLAEKLNCSIECNEDSHEIEYFGQGVVKGSSGGEMSGLSKAKVSFSNQPSLYIGGKRTICRIRNLEKLLDHLVKSKIDWSILNRIVVETHVVHHAHVCCSTNSASDVIVSYDNSGLPLSVDADYARKQTGLIHHPHVTGTIAFGAIRLVPLWGVLAGSAGPAFTYRELDVHNPADIEDF